MIGVMLSNIVSNSENIDKLKKDYKGLCFVGIIGCGCLYLLTKLSEQHEHRIAELESTINEIKSKGE